MNGSHACARWGAIFLWLASAPLVWAQANSASPTTGTNVAVIDVGEIFESHPGFKQAMDGLKQEVQAVESRMRERRTRMESIRERMKQFETGSADYKEHEAEIMKIQAEGQIEATQKKKDFIEREAQLYYTFYREIVAEIEAFSRQHGIGLVLRFSRNEMDVKNPQSVLEGVNQPIVYQNRIDITNAIKDQIGRRYASRAGSGSVQNR